MSVVNKMLNDLDQRGAVDDPDDLDGEYAQPAEAKRVKNMVLFIIVVVTVAAAYFTYRTLGKQYFVDLYTQVEPQVMDLLGIEQEKKKQSKKVSLNPALDQMMPTRAGDVAVPDLTEIATQAPNEAKIAEMAQMLVDGEMATETAAENITQPEDLPEISPMIPQERTKRIVDTESPVTTEMPEVVAENRIETSEIEPETSETEDLPPQITRTTPSDNNARITELSDLASQAMNNKRPMMAAAYLRELLGLQPDDVSARKKLAVILYSNNDKNGARSMLGDGINLLPDRPDFRLMLARIYFKEQNYFAAYETLEPMEPEIKTHPEYYALQANVAKELAMFVEASHLYGRLALNEPGRAQWWLGLAISLDKSGESNGAVKAYERASDLRQLSASAEDFIRERILALGG
ncbi:MAG: tetratricopeptide repeat protein [Aestuariibacter sp.]